ncbi:unnamed protein product [Moneuplotes crassus]|uniref:Poly [ADP-ribose] polymerase n=1 Tax=Euplotes crassus TaxID=5936 RepID=A0AAD1U8A4_EUPCR|nr:unnamed protein product [Moneuplotes crassus]
MVKTRRGKKREIKAVAKKKGQDSSDSEEEKIDTSVQNRGKKKADNTKKTKASAKSKPKAKGSTKNKKQKKAKRKKSEDSGQESDASGSDKSKSSKKSAKEEEKIKEVTSSISHGVMVDHKVPGASGYEVIKHGSQVLSAHLMCADLEKNNNKFYIAQGLKKSSGCYLWTRWGRVGIDGKTKMINASTEQFCANLFNKKVNDKKNHRYKEVELAVEPDKKSKQNSKAKIKKKKTIRKEKSGLPPKVQNLIRFIFNMNLIEKSVVKVGYNVKKMPLGNLSKQTISDGYTILKSIEKELAKKKPINSTLSTLSGDFYTTIPHDIGYKKLKDFIINTPKILKEKLDLVDSLRDIRIAAEIVNQVDDGDDDANELDAQYKKMNCEIVPMDDSFPEYKTLLKALETTHGKTHHFKLTPIDVFKIEREGEQKKFDGKVGNKMLLWHGSRFSNFGGILSQGLRIAPPEAPVSGYMFGKGVYFADIVSKSAGYCCSHLSNKEGLLLLCEVAIGETNDLTNAKYDANKLPRGKHSTLGMGKWIPDHSEDIDDAKIFMGPIQEESKTKNRCLRYNEYITYDIDRIVMKYLFRCKFS